MSTRDLAAKYGKNKRSALLINAAVRAELPGGNELLDAVAQLDQAVNAMQRDDRGFQRLRRALEAVRAAIDELRAEIRDRYGMPPREEP